MTLMILQCTLFGCSTLNEKQMIARNQSFSEAGKTFTKQELIKDLQQLEKIIMTKNPLYFTDETELEQRFQNAYHGIEDEMTELQFYRLINPVVTAVHCGHTNLSISEELLAEREGAMFFPIKVTLINDRLFALEDDVEAGLTAGDEIVSINGKRSEEIINQLISNISGDGDSEAKSRYIISKHFNSKYYDFVDRSERFQVVRMNTQGIQKTMELQAKPRDAFNTTAWDLHFTEYKEESYYTSKIYDEYAVLTVNFFTNKDSEKFNAFLKEFFQELSKRNSTKLIIDVRGNYGGDSFMAKELLSYITEKQIVYIDSEMPFYYKLLGFHKPVTPQEKPFHGEVVVLTDGAGFSTTAHFCALVKHHKLGTLIGNETGGGTVCTDASKDAVLKNTKLRLHYSTQIFRVKTDGMTDKNVVKPDLFVPLMIEDLLLGNDAIMEAGLKELFHPGSYN